MHIFKGVPSRRVEGAYTFDEIQNCMFLPLMKIFLPSPVKIGSAPEEKKSGHASD